MTDVLVCLVVSAVMLVLCCPALAAVTTLACAVALGIKWVLMMIVKRWCKDDHQAGRR